MTKVRVLLIRVLLIRVLLIWELIRELLILELLVWVLLIRKLRELRLEWELVRLLVRVGLESKLILILGICKLSGKLSSLQTWKLSSPNLKVEIS